MEDYMQLFIGAYQARIYRQQLCKECLAILARPTPKISLADWNFVLEQLIERRKSKAQLRNR
jgi:hypothetical protein